MGPSQERLEHLTQKLVTYYTLYQKCSDGLRHLGSTRMNDLYNDALKKWQSDPSNPLFEPPPNDEKKRELYFAKCDEICGIEPNTPDDHFKISFACWAGIQVIRSQELDGISNRNKILANANELAAKAYSKTNPDVQLLPDSPDSMDPQLPSHLLSAVYPSNIGSATASALGTRLINEKLRCQDKETGQIMEFTVQDYGTSHLKGEWYEVMYDDLRVQQITARELKEMLANRVVNPQ